MGTRYDAATIDVSITESPQLLALPRGVRLMHIEAIVWARQHRTDGAIPRHALRRLTDEPDVEAAVAQLVQVDEWAVTDEGWILTRYGELQMSKGAVEREVRGARERWERFRERRLNVADNGVSGGADNGAANAGKGGRKRTIRPTDARSARSPSEALAPRAEPGYKRPESLRKCIECGHLTRGRSDSGPWCPDHAMDGV